MSLKQVENALSAGTLNFVITGDAGWLVERAVDRALAWGRERCGPPAFNLQNVRCSEPNAAAHLASARTLPMMADLRVVVVRDLAEADDAFMSSLLGYLESSSPSTLLIVTGAGAPKVKKGGSNWALRLGNAMKSAGVWVKFAAADTQPIGFAREYASSLGKTLAQPDAQLLVEVVGGDLGRLARELEKLACYVGDQPEITSTAIHEASSLLAEAVIFDLTAGIASRNPDAALRSLHRLLDEGNASHQLLAMVAWQLRLMLQAAELFAAGQNDWNVRETLKISAFQVERMRKALGTSPVDAAATLHRLARANRAMNSHRAGDRHVFERLIVDLSRGA
jgi:DNA polymerase-3 subunit delta